MEVIPNLFPADLEVCSFEDQVNSATKALLEIQTFNLTLTSEDQTDAAGHLILDTLKRELASWCFDDRSELVTPVESFINSVLQMTLLPAVRVFRGWKSVKMKRLDGNGQAQIGINLAGFISAIVPELVTASRFLDFPVGRPGEILFDLGNPPVRLHACLMVLKHRGSLRRLEAKPIEMDGDTAATSQKDTKPVKKEWVANFVKEMPAFFVGRTTSTQHSSRANNLLTAINGGNAAAAAEFRSGLKDLKEGQVESRQEIEAVRNEAAEAVVLSTIVKQNSESLAKSVTATEEALHSLREEHKVLKEETYAMREELKALRAEMKAKSDEKDVLFKDVQGLKTRSVKLEKEVEGALQYSAEVGAAFKKFRAEYDASDKRAGKK